MIRIMSAGLREEFARYRAERQKKEEPIEARVLNAVLSSSATPYRYFVQCISCLQIATSERGVHYDSTSAESSLLVYDMTF